MTHIDTVTSLAPEEMEQIAVLLPQLMPDAECDVDANLQTLLDSPTSRLLTARLPDDQIVGFAVGNLVPKIVGTEGRINDVVVDEGYRRQGIGRALCERTIEELISAGAYKVEWHCKPELIAANALYRSLAGPPTGTGTYKFYA